jgi:hypothetical protein
MSDQVYNIRFLTIELISKSLSEPSSATTGLFNFNFVIDIKVDASRNLAVIMSDISINNLDVSSIMARFKIACVFELPEFNRILTKIEENKYEIPEDLEIILKSAALASARGVIYSELRGTYLHGAILPLIDIATLVKTDREKLAKSQVTMVE